jgi:hypothetical protein
MKRFNLLLSVALLFALASCSSSKTDENLYQANATKLMPWINNDVLKELKTPEHPFAFFVDTIHEYSYGFKIKAKNLNIKSPKKITISCDAYLYNAPTKVQLVIDMKNNGNNLLWQGQNFAKENADVSKWKTISFSVDIPKDFNVNTDIAVYVWSPAKEAALIDNLSIKFE